MGKITVLGAGNAACTYAAYMGARGHDVCLYEVEALADNLTDVAAAGGFEITGCGLDGFGPVALTTTDIETAVRYADYILAVVPAFAHKILAEQCAPYLKSGQTVILNPGNMFGAVEFINVLRKNGNREDVTVGEVSSSVFACRRYRPNLVTVLGIKEKMQLACIPAARTEQVVKDLQEYLPQYVAVPNVIYTGLQNINAFVHPISAVLNMPRMEMKDDFDFYWEGISPGVCANMEAIDLEKMALGERLGFPQTPLCEELHNYYGHPEWPSLYEFFSHSEIHGGSPASRAPKTTHHRYITEDLPYGVVPMADLARVAGIPTPHMDAIITLGSTFNGTDYRKEGRTMENLGFGGLTAEEICDRVINGF